MEQEMQNNKTNNKKEIKTMLNKEKNSNKFDGAIKMSYLIFACGAAIIAVSVGVMNNDWQTWVQGLLIAICGAAAFGFLAHFIISLIRNDKPNVNKYDLVSRSLFILFYIVASIAFIGIGFQYMQTKIWIIAFVGAYGAATIYASVAKLIITVIKVKKEKSINNNNGNKQ